MTNIEISKEQLEEIYLTKNYTRNKTAEYFGVKPRYIKILVSKYGLNKTKEQWKLNCKGGCTKGKFWWNNGKDEVYAVECPGSSFIRGKINRGLLWWNNGIRNKQSKECPGEGWVTGILLSEEERLRREEEERRRIEEERLRLEQQK